MAIEIFPRMLPSDWHLSQQLDDVGGLQARKVPAMADIARTRVIAIVPVAGQNSSRCHHRKRANSEQCGVKPDSICQRHLSQPWISIAPPATWDALSASKGYSLHHRSRWSGFVGVASVG